MQRYLPGLALPDQLQRHRRRGPGPAVAASGLAIVGTPMAGLRPTLAALPAGARVLWLCKGFEAGSGLLGHEIARATRPPCCCGVLSGPSFAQEVARFQPTALVAASADEALCRAGGAGLPQRQPACLHSAPTPWAWKWAAR
jgi:glycerol-3-phosphate dehydrogenase (NAD(P)+)